VRSVCLLLLLPGNRFELARAHEQGHKTLKRGLLDKRGQAKIIGAAPAPQLVMGAC